MRPLPELTVLIQYRLIGTEDAFRNAISKLASRVQTEGHRGILAYRFYVNADAGFARAVVDYENAQAWIGHHDIAMGWPEMVEMHGVARLSKVTFLGELTAEIESWIASSNLNVEVQGGYDFASGFLR